MLVTAHYYYVIVLMLMTFMGYSKLRLTDEPLLGGQSQFQSDGNGIGCILSRERYCYCDARTVLHDEGTALIYKHYS